MVLLSNSSYRPIQWSTPSPAKVIITFPGQPKAGQYSNASGSTVTLPTSQTLYAFDTEIEVEHEQQLRQTEHPVQTGASISDHAFVVPAHLILDIGMSDVMDSYYKPSTWQGSPSKSVSAYQTMLALQFSRIPFSITTRLRTYSNMIVRSLSPRDNARTIQGLRMRVEFAQIFIADIVTTPDSARPQDTNTTNLGTVNPQQPTATENSQNNVAGSSAPTVPSTTIGPGAWSSVNTNNLNSLPAGK